MSVKIPVYAVMGFLDAGKSTLIDDITSWPRNQSKQMLLLSFEEGDHDMVDTKGLLVKVSYDAWKMRERMEDVIASIQCYIRDVHPDEIWVEWNGLLPFSVLEQLLLESILEEEVVLQKVIYVGKEEMLRTMLGKTGEAPIEQIKNSDIGLIRGGKGNSVVQKINKEMDIYSKESRNRFIKEVYRREKISSTGYFLMSCVIVLLMVTTPILEQVGGSTNRWIISFMGIMLQAIPFLMIGVLLSSFIQVYVSSETLQRIFPKKNGLGMFAAIGLGFCIPVCDCTSIPVFKSLVKKGVPLSMAITFMTVSPVINPVVILSTYYAFQGDFTVVLARFGLGIICAVLVGVSFMIRTPKDYLKSEGMLTELCDCGCQDMLFANSERGKKFSMFLRHSQVEFFLVCRYLMYGAGISVLLQMVSGNRLDDMTSAPVIVQVVIMMALAFAFSLCSSSDAVIAKSYSTLVAPAGIMGFLVFGPMMDLKNIMMLSSAFEKRFLFRLLITTFLVCFLVVAVVYSLGSGGVMP